MRFLGRGQPAPSPPARGYVERCKLPQLGPEPKGFLALRAARLPLNCVDLLVYILAAMSVTGGGGK